jgi:hypothetical protein
MVNSTRLDFRAVAWCDARVSRRRLPRAIVCAVVALFVACRGSSRSSEPRPIAIELPYASDDALRATVARTLARAHTARAEDAGGASSETIRPPVRPTGAPPVRGRRTYFIE